jgi:glycosyltransferase involved in cell wall biosynthesis
MVKNLKVAIIHDLLLEYGGAERVVAVLCDLFPTADVYTFYYNHTDPTLRKSFNHRVTGTSFVQKLPYVYMLGPLFSVFKLVSWIYFLKLNLQSYDLIISSSHSYNAKICEKRSSAKHICYLHTSPKYLYEEKNELLFIKKFPFNGILYPLFAILRFLDRKGAQKPDVLIANSQLVSNRIAAYYHRSSVVIYPPVIFGTKKLDIKKGKYFIAHSRLVKQKGIDLIVKTCTQYKIPLVVIGEGYQREYLESIAGRTIIFCGRVPDSVLRRLYQHASALLYAAVDEDFGLVPVEAMSMGVPIIAFKSGGVTETILSGKTGVFFTSYTTASLWKAIQKFTTLSFSRVVLQKHAQEYRRSVFEKKIMLCIQSELQKTP